MCVLHRVGALQNFKNIPVKHVPFFDHAIIGCHFILVYTGVLHSVFIFKKQQCLKYSFWCTYILNRAFIYQDTMRRQCKINNSTQECGVYALVYTRNGLFVCSLSFTLEMDFPFVVPMRKLFLAGYPRPPCSARIIWHKFMTWAHLEHSELRSCHCPFSISAAKKEPVSVNIFMNRLFLVFGLACASLHLFDVCLNLLT